MALRARCHTSFHVLFSQRAAVGLHRSDDIYRWLPKRIHSRNPNSLVLEVFHDCFPPSYFFSMTFLIFHILRLGCGWFETFMTMILLSVFAARYLHKRLVGASLSSPSSRVKSKREGVRRCLAFRSSAKVRLDQALVLRQLFLVTAHLDWTCVTMHDEYRLCCSFFGHDVARCDT